MPIKSKMKEMGRDKMDRNIYDLLNETTVDLEQYEKREMTMLEQKRAMKSVGTTNKKRGKGYKKYVAVAAVAVLSIGVLPVMATTNPVAYKIASMLGIEKNLDDYATAVNKVVSKDGITVGLGEVMYDRDNQSLMLTTYITLEDETVDQTDLSKYHLNANIYINGEELNTAMAWSAQVMNDNTIAYMMDYRMPSELDGEHAVTIKMPQIMANGVEHRGSWNFEFSVDGAALKEASTTERIDQAVSLSAGDVVFTKYVTNPIGTYIYYTLSDNHFVSLKGTDNLGNEVVFVQSSGVFVGEGKVELAPGYTINPEATSLELEAFEKEDSVSTGETITVVLP